MNSYAFEKKNVPQTGPLSIAGGGRNAYRHTHTHPHTPAHIHRHTDTDTDTQTHTDTQTNTHTHSLSPKKKKKQPLGSTKQDFDASAYSGTMAPSAGKQCKSQL